jgi:cyanophycinase
MKPQGKLLIIGGAEHKAGNESLDMENKNIKFKHYEILRDLLEASRNKPIEIITTGSKIQNEVRKSYEKAFHKIGYYNLGFLPIKYKREGSNKDYLKRINEAGAVFFTGGDQFRLSTIIGGTKIIEAIKHRYYTDNDFLVAGTSAGAMAMSQIMITEGGLEEALIARDLKLSSGFGLLAGSIIDSHFIKRGRFGRLAHAIIMNPDKLGIGLGEDTALIIKKGNEAHCRGSGMVVIIDGKKIQHTNIANAKMGEPIYVDNLRVQLLVKGCVFSLKTRKIIYPKY